MIADYTRIRKQRSSKMGPNTSLGARSLYDVASAVLTDVLMMTIYIALLCLLFPDGVLVHNAADGITGALLDDGLFELCRLFGSSVVFTLAVSEEERGSAGVDIDKGLTRGWREGCTCGGMIKSVQVRSSSSIRNVWQLSASPKFYGSKPSHEFAIMICA
jgi:hypothetical protein